MAKRGAGEGSIVKRKKCDACGKTVSAASEKDLKLCKHCKAVLPKDGTWMGAATAGFDVAKNKPDRRYYYGKTRAEVIEKMEAVKARVKSGQITEPSKMLLAEWLDTWLNDYMKPSLRPTTWESYETQVRKHIKPAIGHIRLSQLQTAHLQKLYNEKLSGGRADGKEGGLSPRSVRYIHNTIHGSLEQAKKEGLIYINPADAVKLPKEEKKEIKYLDSEGITKFLAAARDAKQFNAYYLELATGLRRGELLALRWQDVDFKNNSVTVRQNLVRTKAGLTFQSPKTALANRTINIPAEVAGVLEFHKRRQNNEREKAGEAWQDNNLVFCNEIGRPYCPRSFSRGFERLTKRAGLEGITFHGLRHTFATMSLQEGVDYKTTQEALGHYDPAFTLRVYSGVTQKMKQEATSKIGNLLNSCLGQ